MSVSLSTCYNNLSFGRWEELCHEFMSVLPMENPRMSFDGLSSPTWHFIFLKDDCFLQPSCEIISSSDLNTFPSNLTTINNQHHLINNNNQYYSNNNNNNNDHDNMFIYDDEYDNDNLSTSSSSSQSLYSLISSPTIEPLFDGIDLNQQHNESENNDNINNNENKNDNRNINNKKKNNDKKDETIVHDKQQKSIQSKKPILITLKRKRRKTQKQQEQHYSIKKDHQHKKKKYDINNNNNNNRLSSPTTLFEQLSQVGIDWCRYCGTTEGVNWRPGPWGKRTLCNKHGCDYKGYGLASRLPRLDLSNYRNEHIEDRLRPVIQEFCSICQERGKLINMIDIKDDSDSDDDLDDDDLRLIPCDGGCSRAFHLKGCLQMNKENNQSKGFHIQQDNHLWYCSHTCYENRKKKKVVVDLPRKQPLMRPLK